MALDYDGVDDVVSHGDINAIDGAANLTIGFWINWTTQETNASWVSKVASVGIEGIDTEEAATNAFRWHVSNGGWNTYGTTGNIMVAGWQHITLYYDGGGAANADRAKVYRNAAEASLTFTGTIPTTIGSSTEPFRVGGGGREGVFANVDIGQVKMWTASLTPLEIRQDMHSYRPVRRRNLILWSHYDDGIQARDYSGTGNHGTVTGALTEGGPPQIPHHERFMAQRLRHGGLGLWGHRLLVK